MDFCKLFPFFFLVPTFLYANFRWGKNFYSNQFGIVHHHFLLPSNIQAIAEVESSRKTLLKSVIHLLCSRWPISPGSLVVIAPQNLMMGFLSRSRHTRNFEPLQYSSMGETIGKPTPIMRFRALLNCREKWARKRERWHGQHLRVINSVCINPSSETPRKANIEFYSRLRFHFLKLSDTSCICVEIYLSQSPDTYLLLHSHQENGHGTKFKMNAKKVNGSWCLKIAGKLGKWLDCKTRSPVTINV